MILITSISVQDKLDYHGRRQAYVMELAGPHSADEFVIEIGEEIYHKLIHVYEANGPGLPGSPVTVEPATRSAPPPPTATSEEFDSIRRKLLEAEASNYPTIPTEFAGRPLSPEETNLLVGIGVDFGQDEHSGDVLDSEEDDGELLNEDADQL